MTEEDEKNLRIEYVQLCVKRKIKSNERVKLADFTPSLRRGGDAKYKRPKIP